MPTAVCQTAGTDGNGLKAGEIAALVDPLPYTLSVTNTGASLGGADRETDEELAERIYLSPTSYSTAGPLAAYEYWVKLSALRLGNAAYLVKLREKWIFISRLAENFRMMVL